MDEINPYLLFQENSSTPTKDVSTITNEIKQSNGVVVEGDNTPPPPPISEGIDLNNIFNQEQSKTVSMAEYNINPEEVYTRVGDENISRYPVFYQGIDNEKLYAETQSTAQKWGRGINKFFQKTGTAVIGGTVGTLVGIPKAIREGRLSAIYDNDFNQMLDEYNEKLDARLPNYYTQQEQEMDFWESMGTANFWANDVLGGLSFTAGLIVSEGIWAAATGGTSLVARGMGNVGRWSSRLLGKNTSLQALNKFKEPTKRLLNNTTLKDWRNVQNISTRAAEVPKALNQARFIYTSAGYEAGVEARHYTKEMEDEWLMNFQEDNGRMPTIEERTDFYNETQDSGNAVFGVNLALVGGSNMAVFGKMLLGRTSRPAINNSAINREMFGLGYTMENGVATAMKANTRQQIARRVFPLGKAALIEGIYEEGGQAVTSQAVKDYVLSSYDYKNTAETADLIESVMGGLRETFTTREGQKEVGIGMIIGLLGGGIAPAVTGMRGQQQQIENAVERRNQYTPERVLASQITMERLRANNKIIKASESKQAAQERGDITGEYISDKQAIIASVERDTFLQGKEQGKEDFAAYVNTVNNEDLGKQLGLKEESDINNWKAQRIQEYNDLADNYERNERYARAMLGSNIAGANNLTEKSSTEELIRALAFNMTIGEQSKDFTEKIVADIKTLIGNNFSTDSVITALEVDNALSNVSREAKEEFQSVNEEVQALKVQIRNAERELVSEQYNPGQSTPEQHTTRLQELQGRIIELQEQEVELNGRRDLAYSALGIENDLVTVEDLEAQSERMSTLSNVVEKYKQNNPQLGTQLENLIYEYGKAKANTIGFNEITRTLTNPNLRLKTIEGWLGGIINKNATIEEATAEVFINQINQYQQNQVQGSIDTFTPEQTTTPPTTEQGDEMTPPQPESTAPVTDEVYQEFIDNGNVPAEVLRGIALKVMAQQTDNFTEQEQAIFTGKTQEINDIIRDIHEGNPVETLKGMVTDIMSGGAYTRYIGKNYDEAVKKKPDEAEINRYEELVGKLVPNFITNFQELMEAPLSYFSSNNIETGITQTELQELRTLQEKLNNWKVMRGSVGNQNASVAELIQLIEQLERTTNQETVQSEVSDSQLGEMKNSAENQATKSETAEGVQSPDQVMTRLNDGVYTISHLNVQSLTNLFPNSTLELVEGKTRTPIDSLTPTKRNNSVKREGAKFILTTPEGSAEVTIGEKSRLNIKKAELDILLPNSRLTFVTIPRRDYVDIYETLENGDSVPLRGDFTYADLTGQVDLLPEVVNNIEDGQILITRLNVQDEYNARIIKRYNGSKKTENDLNELMNNLHIYVTDQKGQLVGSLRANNNLPSNSATSNLIEIRRKATEMLLNEERDPNDTYFSIREAVPVKVNLIGSPNLVVNSEGQVQHIDFTDTAIEQIEDVGFMEGETVQTRKGNVNEIVKTFLPKSTAVRVPFVVARVNGKSVAYPVSLKTSTVNLTEAINTILNTNTNEVQKLTKLNNLLIANGLQPSRYIVEESGNLGINRERLNQDTQNLEVLPVLDQWLEDSYSLDRLQNEATISINLDNKPFNLSKIMLDLSNRKSIGTQEELRMDYDNIESREIELRDSLQTAVGTIMGPAMNQYQEVDNVRWTNVLFAEGALERNPENDLQQRMNVNMMRNALYYGDGKRARVPKAVVEAYGQEFIDNLRKDLEALDKITALKKDTRTAIKNTNTKKEAEQQNTEC